MSVVRALREDRFLHVATACLTLAAWAPLFVTPFLPLSDLHNNAAAASMLPDALLGRGRIGESFHVDLIPLPYWTGDVIMAIASLIGGVLFGAKAIVAILAVLLPLSVMRLLLALGRSPRLGLWVFAAFWDHNAYSGWVTYLLGMAFAFFALARLVEMETSSDAAKAMGWSLLVGLTHPQALALLDLCALALAYRAGRRRAIQTAAIVLWGALPLVPWLARSGAFDRSPSVALEWHSPAQKAALLFAHTFDCRPAPWTTAGALAFGMMLAGPPLLALLAPKGGAGRERTGGAAIVFLACVALYLLLPETVRGTVSHFRLYGRYATFILISALLLPRPDLRGLRAVVLAPGILAAIATDLSVWKQFRAFGEHSRPFLGVIAAVTPGSSVLPLMYRDSDPACAYDPYNEFHAYLAAITKSYDPYLFDHPAHPLRYTSRGRPALPPWYVVRRDLVMEREGSAFDYVLVQGLEGDPFRSGGRLEHADVRRVAEGGIWRLYGARRDRRPTAGAP